MTQAHRQVMLRIRDTEDKVFPSAFADSVNCRTHVRGLTQPQWLCKGYADQPIFSTPARGGSTAPDLAAGASSPQADLADRA